MPGLVDARDNFRLEPRQQDAAVVAGRRLRHQFAEFFPVGNFVQLADFFAGERAVLETDQRHVAAGRRAEHMAFAAFVGLAFFHGAEKGVARAQADGHLAGLDEAQADDARRIVAGPDGGQGFGIQAEFVDEIRADRADDAAGFRERRQLFRRGPARWP